MWKCSTVQFIIKLVVLKKGSRRLPQVFLVPEPVSEPHTKKLENKNTMMKKDLDVMYFIV